jgi:thymidylate synthase (FAD)
MELINDKYFRLEVLSCTTRPNLLAYLALHQCYAEQATADDLPRLSTLSDEELGRRVVEKCVKFGHFSVLEHPVISFNVIGFPHSVMAQATRHRHISFSVQSQRYTGERIVTHGVKIYGFNKGALMDKDLIQELFYFRPLGSYQDRIGNYYEYDEKLLEKDLNDCTRAILDYHERVIEKKLAPEHARDFLPQNIRQDFVMTMNARSLMHFCDLRLPKDAQLEIRTLANMMLNEFKNWMPEVAEWYIKNRAEKNKLAP